MSQHKYTNQLINESSPYLLQHAHNPVNWFAWGDEALQLAQKEDKPILISIGYSACHWCHVMERESFEDVDTAAIMNNYFINIKVDREERPDLDHIYMDAVQAISGSGGWPLNVFLTPEGKPFYGGTYFPPTRLHNRSSWKEVLGAIHTAFSEKRSEIELQASNLIQHINAANAIGKNNKEKDVFIFNVQMPEKIAEQLLKNADTNWGGFGGAPKFPQTFSIQFLLRQYYFTGNQNAAKQALLSLDKMIQGGIYDHLGGGFARYSTDNEWLAPHFEKMLYDNALLVMVLCEAFQLTQNDIYTDAITQTLSFIQNELQPSSGGFFSALDADSEGVEGKFYIWHKQEIDEILTQDSSLFCEIYGVTENGNWEHSNILWLPQSILDKALELGFNEKELKSKLSICRSKLLAVRNKRIKPQLDDKILLGWNALMISALCKASAALQKKDFMDTADTSIKFLESTFQKENGEWFHAWKNNGKYSAFLDDYAYLIQAYIHLQEITGKQEYLLKAKQLLEFVIINFQDSDSAFFYFTPSYQTDIVVRKKEVYDGATPSGNSVMALNLFYLGIIFDIPDWKIMSNKMVEAMGNALINYPGSFGIWSSIAQQMIYGVNEISVIGKDVTEKLVEINGHYIPNKVIQSTMVPNENFPMLKGKFPQDGIAQIYLCKDYSCKRPVNKVEDLLAHLEVGVKN